MRSVFDYMRVCQHRETLLQLAGVSDPATLDAVLLTSRPVDRLFAKVVKTAAQLPRLHAAERIALGVAHARDPFQLHAGQKAVVLAAPVHQPREALSQSRGPDVGRQSCPPRGLKHMTYSPHRARRNRG